MTVVNDFYHKHRHLLGYLFIVVVAVAAVELHHLATTKELRDVQHKACHDSEIVSRNQRLVLTYLIDFNSALGNNTTELKEARAKVPRELCD